MLTILTLSSIFVGATFPRSYEAGSQFCSGKAVRLGTTFVGFQPQGLHIVPYKHGLQPTVFNAQGDIYIYIYTYQIQSIASLWCMHVANCMAIL